MVNVRWEQQQQAFFGLEIPNCWIGLGVEMLRPTAELYPAGMVVATRHDLRHLYVIHTTQPRRRVNMWHLVALGVQYDRPERQPIIAGSTNRKGMIGRDRQFGTECLDRTTQQRFKFGNGTGSPVCLPSRVAWLVGATARDGCAQMWSARVLFKVLSAVEPT